MLDLHVWGSALGLPSIDPECLAIITYLNNALPSTAWRIIPSNDPSASPSNLLPALNHDGAWTSGYRPIVDYLTSKSLCTDLDSRLNPAQQADVVAYSAYLTAHAAPLVDLSLYVSAANWSATTRPAYSTLLPFPLTWTVPPLIRAEAVKRAEHLGLAELDRDFDPNGGLHLSTGRESLPETFRRHLPVNSKKTVAEEMTPEQAAAIRIHSITESCLLDLDELMQEGDRDGKKLRFFSGLDLSSLDCLAFGYLALMWEPPVPRPFLKVCMQKASPRLWRFVDDIKTNRIGVQADLPWAASTPSHAGHVTTRTIDTVLHHVPNLGEYYVGEMRRRAEEGIKGVDQRAVMLTLGLMLTGLAVSYGTHVYKALAPFGARTQTWKPQRNGSKLSQFGELGSMLSSAMGPVYAAPRQSAGLNSSMYRQSRIVETDSEVD